LCEGEDSMENKIAVLIFLLLFYRL